MQHHTAVEFGHCVLKTSLCPSEICSLARKRCLVFHYITIYHTRLSRLGNGQDIQIAFILTVILRQSLIDQRNDILR